MTFHGEGCIYTGKEALRGGMRNMGVRDGRYDAECTGNNSLTCLSISC